MADLINTPDDDVFKQFVKSQKEKEEAEALKRGGNGGGEYKGEQVKFCAALEGGHIVVRFVGAPPSAAYKPGDALIRCISEIKDDAGKKMILVLPERADTLEQDHIMWRIVSKVLEKEYVNKKRVFINQIEHKTAFDIVSKGGWKPEDGNSYLYTKGWNAPEILLVNCLDRTDNWCKENKHTKVFSKNVYISPEKGFEKPDIGVKANGFLSKLIENMGKYGSWSKYDSYVIREGDKEKRKKEPFKVINGSGFKAAGMIAELEGITDAELNLISTEPGLTAEELTYKSYDLADCYRVSSYTKLFTRISKQVKAIDADLGTRFYDELKALAEQEKKEREIDAAARKAEQEAAGTVGAESASVESTPVAETTAPAAQSFDSMTPVADAAPARRVVTDTPAATLAGLTPEKIALLKGWDGLEESEKALITDVVLKADGTVDHVVYADGCGNQYPCPTDQGGCGSLSPESFKSCPVCGKRWG